ncbi:hypothetical protein LAUMK4_04342 [Mycobacterium persicum]|uniref:Uncharacterized protein n=1 Tax=Mycobacterium persicum TaxID=1487726 RepID=A0ABY6RNB6_9MYCO|nr:hypothetical protein LAUMK15_04750 [Mycobacterium persicum]VAZ98763.1 hypothetical protein LAUMK4_04342 [Mycobacterium persicum]
MATRKKGSIVITHRTDKEPHRFVGEVFWNNACIFESRPDEFKTYALLRIHFFGFIG